MKSRLLALLAAASLFICQGALASTINIFNTGTDAAGNVVPDSTVGDLHYQLIAAPGGAASTIKAVTSASGYPIGPWLGDDTVSRWIGPNTQTLSGPAGLYVYRTQFTLTAAQVAGASLTGFWSGDDGGGPGAGIFLNALNVGAAVSSFSAFDPYSISTGFIVGVNNLDFAVFNFGGPTGLRVMADQARAVPEPASLGLLGLGLLGLAARRRRKAARA